MPAARASALVLVQSVHAPTLAIRHSKKPLDEDSSRSNASHAASKQPGSMIRQAERLEGNSEVGVRFEGALAETECLRVQRDVNMHNARVPYLAADQ
jgi:hypothetical protein